MAEKSFSSRRTVLGSIGSLGIGLTGFSGSTLASNGEDDESLGDDFETTLHEIAADTWSFFDAFATKETGLVPDRVDAEGEAYEPADHTSPANIGVQLLSTVAASNLDILEASEAHNRIETILDTIEDLETWNGHLYRWYDVHAGSIEDEFGGWWEISTIDNGWYTAGLVTAAGAFPALQSRIDALLSAQNYEILYDSEVYNPFADDFSFGHLLGGYDARNDESLGFHYGTFNSETRISSYVAIGKGDVPGSHWWDPFRTFPPEWGQNKDPEGEFRTYEGERVWEGHYEHDGTKYVPSWGGSMFESLMPSLVLPELEVGGRALGENNARQVQLQIDHAEEQGYDAWGFSPCAVPDSYAEFAVDYAGIYGYNRDDFATPHATFLGLEYADRSAVESSLEAYTDRGLYTKYGFFDSMSVVDDTVTESYLLLDQAISLVAIANYLTDGSVRHDFRRHSIGEEPTDLLAKERFTI
ncbi:glucoamylase family protein [Natronosalvus rutilus]|uniref:DUF3131 domain-containing protein n=1 Tax=Natronosalvus rutilus TaxID=2953753 RepID=A0A9E7N5R0_9EURY|nr:glucoamylase family protein [Natronosalvus rutilus]UTF52229.1 DUF3131 domain-containing protein [Natronosalvus rutilus]